MPSLADLPISRFPAAMPRAKSTTSLSEFIAAEVRRVFGAASAAVVAAPATPAAPPKRRGRPPGSGKKPAAATRRTAAKKAPKSLRGSAAATERDVATVLGFMRNHPGLRTEAIAKGIGGDLVLVKSALKHLRGAGRVTTEGITRGTRYTAS